MHGALSDLAGAGTGWYCGDSDAKPPSTTLRYDRALPMLPEQTACLSASEKETTDEGRSLCDRAAQVTDQALPDDITGNCVKDRQRAAPTTGRSARPASSATRADAHAAASICGTPGSRISRGRSGVGCAATRRRKRAWSRFP